ncbi:MAG: nucleotidyltransferase family protein [Bryobacterales bacterium]|nr:nucleotidyltransferase family protein [Bryobacterales bacterium]
MHVLIESRRSEIRALAEGHGFHDVWVFGSMARGDVDEHSDIDLSATLPTGKTGLALGALLMDVQDLLGRRVNVVTEGCLHPSFRSRVLKEAQLL